MTGVRLTQLEVPDYDIGLRGKLYRADKLEPGGEVRFCTILHGLSLVDEVTDTRASNQGNGYPDAPVVLDESTRIDLPWRDGAQAVIGDLVDEDGQPVPASARGHVARLQERFADHGVQPVFGFEYEVWLFEDEPGARKQRLRPLGRTENAYSLARSTETYRLGADFVDRMEAVGIPVEAFHSELGPGFFEFALKPKPALQAADGAARAREYFREVCSEHGLRASFMAKPYADRSGAGGHVHSSVVRDAANVFASAPGELSSTGSGFLAGLLETMADLTVMFNPFVNSYKRLDKEMFVAERATWGVDDRSAACRVLLDSMPGARVEHRRPGADASPYLVAAAILGGGLAGIEEERPLPQPAEAEAASLPASLGPAVELFEGSSRAQKLFGDEFVQGYAATRRNELTRYERWLRTTITDWETDRYLEHL